MKIGVIISTNDPETVWNAFRFANFSMDAGDEVRVFLIGKGVEAEKIEDERFNVREQMEKLIGKGGTILSCGTCLKIRGSKPEICPISTMKDLHQIVRESDRIVTF